MRLAVAETFARFIYAPDYSLKLETLLRPVDEQSRAVVLDVLNRHRYILTYNLLKSEKNVFCQ